MNPLLFANWRHINQAFVALCWIVAVALTCLILAELQPDAAVSPQHARAVVVGR